MGTRATILLMKNKNNIIFPQDLYQKFLDSDLEENIPKEEDPFWEPPEPVLIGTANAYLQVCNFYINKTTWHCKPGYDVGKLKKKTPWN